MADGVSFGVNLEDLAAARDALLADVEERAGSHALERLARAHRWLGEEDAARRRFRAAAAAAEAVLERWRRDDPSAVSRVGSLLVRARDPEAAAPWLARADAMLRSPDDRAAIAYLRGDFPGAQESARRAAEEEGSGGYPWADAIGTVARARGAGDPELASEALARFADLIRAERTPPDEESGSSGLSLFDWLAESARVRAELAGDAPPAGSELLDEVGLLSAERAPTRAEAPPDVGPTRPGSTTIAYPGPDGGDVEPSVAVDDDLDIHFVLDPARDLRASLVQRDGGWRAQLRNSELPGEFRGPRAAKRAIWDPLREEPHGQWAVALLDRLFRESYRL